MPKIPYIKREYTGPEKGSVYKWPVTRTAGDVYRAKAMGLNVRGLELAQESIEQQKKYIKSDVAMRLAELGLEAGVNIFNYIKENRIRTQYNNAVVGTETEILNTIYNISRDMSNPEKHPEIFYKSMEEIKEKKLNEITEKKAKEAFLLWFDKKVAEYGKNVISNAISGELKKIDASLVNNLENVINNTGNTTSISYETVGEMSFMELVEMEGLSIPDAVKEINNLIDSIEILPYERKEELRTFYKKKAWLTHLEKTLIKTINENITKGDDPYNKIITIADTYRHVRGSPVNDNEIDEVLNRAIRKAALIEQEHKRQIEINAEKEGSNVIDRAIRGENLDKIIEDVGRSERKEGEKPLRYSYLSYEARKSLINWLESLKDKQTKDELPQELWPEVLRTITDSRILPDKKQRFIDKIVLENKLGPKVWTKLVNMMQDVSDDPLAEAFAKGLEEAVVAGKITRARAAQYVNEYHRLAGSPDFGYPKMVQWVNSVIEEINEGFVKKKVGGFLRGIYKALGIYPGDVSEASGLLDVLKKAGLFFEAVTDGLYSHKNEEYKGVPITESMTNVAAVLWADFMRTAGIPADKINENMPLIAALEERRMEKGWITGKTVQYPYEYVFEFKAINPKLEEFAKEKRKFILYKYDLEEKEWVFGIGNLYNDETSLTGYGYSLDKMKMTYKKGKKEKTIEGLWLPVRLLHNMVDIVKIQ